jgi:uncharacterized membrane-anchored protein
MGTETPTPSEGTKKMTDTTVTPITSATKDAIQKSEMWLAVITSLGTLGAGFAMNSNTVTVITLLLTAGTYAFFRTDLAATKPGWKTKAFWGALLSVVGSIALALSQANLPFLPPNVTKVAAMIAAGIASGGYTIYRYTVKKGTTSPAAPPTQDPQT